MTFPGYFMLVALLALPPRPDTDPAVVEALDQAASVMRVQDLRSIRYSGTALSYRLGQSTVPGGPWPEAPANPFIYETLINYESASRRIEKIYRYGDRERRVFQAVAHPLAWDEISAVARPAGFAADERWLQIWVTPHGFVRKALSRDPRLISESHGDTPWIGISFDLPGGFHIRGWIDRQYLVRKVDTWIGDSEGYFGVLGDLLVETSYSEYRDFHGIKFPSRIVQKWGGHPLLEITVEEVDPNPPAEIVVPDSVRNGTAEPFPVSVQSEPLAEGVWLLRGALWHSVAVEFDEYLVVIEAPFSQDRSLAVINELEHLVPGKPIEYVVNTHHHFDHSGGLRAYAAHGATVVTHESNRRFFEQVFSAPRTLRPDLLVQHGTQPEIHTFSDKLELTDERRVLQLYKVEGCQHAAGMLMAYLPAEKLLIEADLFNPPPSGTPIISPLDPEVSNLIRNIKRHSLKVERIVPLHGQPVAMADLLEVAQPSN